MSSSIMFPTPIQRPTARSCLASTAAPATGRSFPLFPIVRPPEESRFEESRALFAAELTPDQVEANMAYVRSLLTQQNRWERVSG